MLPLGFPIVVCGRRRGSDWRVSFYASRMRVQVTMARQEDPASETAMADLVKDITSANNSSLLHRRVGRDRQQRWQRNSDSREEQLRSWRWWAAVVERTLAAMGPRWQEEEV
ncbi:hypothetical protein BHM03_00009743 [Ensete ventricosum]|nr:hypothetical protein BHM03_00009743 [Ensete ventricosum]